MSTFSCPVVKIPSSAQHPNADTLRITTILGETVIFKEGAFREGDLAIYVPEDAVIPKTVPGTEFLGEHRRIRAKKLRGVFSVGLLLPLSVLPPHPEDGLLKLPEDEHYFLGWDVSSILDIVKWVETMPPSFNGENESDPGYMPMYDMESIRKNLDVIGTNEEVVVTEKLHGTNFRAVFRDGKLWVGSHGCIKKESDSIIYWKAAKQYNLAEKLQKYEGIAFYGEIYGNVQDLKYDLPNNEFRLAIFDLYQTHERKWMNFEVVESICKELDLPVVPVVYRGPYYDYSTRIEYYLEGKSAIASHNKEGLVIKPVIERWNQQTGRTIFKLVSEWYRTRKNGTEGH